MMRKHLKRKKKFFRAIGIPVMDDEWFRYVLVGKARKKQRMIGRVLDRN